MGSFIFNTLNAVVNRRKEDRRDEERERRKKLKYK
jgi:hypothetical protein